MSTSKVYTPRKQLVTNSVMTGLYGSPSCAGSTVCFQSLNPFEELAATVDMTSDGSGSTGSPTSSRGSLSTIGRNDPRGAPVTPSRGQAQGRMLPAVKQLNVHGASPHDVRRMSVNENTMSPTFISPDHIRMQAAQGYTYGSPQKPINRRLSQVQVPDGLQGVQRMQLRDSIASQASHHSRASSGRLSLSSSLQSPSRLNPAWNPSTSSMTAIPEVLSVQELAFRHGQQDYHVARDRIPASPFAKAFDEIWASYYKLGKTYGGKPVDTSAASSSASHSNYTWPVLINPYTQNLESPNGHVDLAWARKVCEIALNCMEAMVRATCKRAGDWKNMVIDIPVPCQHALMDFSDLLERYERLKRDGHEALNGGLPQGY